MQSQYRGSRSGCAGRGGRLGGHRYRTSQLLKYEMIMVRGVRALGTSATRQSPTTNRQRHPRVHSVTQPDVTNERTYRQVKHFVQTYGFEYIVRYQSLFRNDGLFNFQTILQLFN